jgi:NAD(P)-dependent dehydrogenase (short-subunit alcohol dehydrogenase family)
LPRLVTTLYFSFMNVKDKVILITGASSGIGRALAGILVGRGAHVALMARSAQTLEDLAAELSLRGGNAAGAADQTPSKVALALPTDVTDRKAVEGAIRACLGHFGRLDILVNCAGIGYFGAVETMTMDDFDTLVKTNLHGVLNAIHAALPALKKSRGIIVNVSSGLAMRALPFLAAYAGTKSMLNALSDGMRLELAPYGVRVLTYCPPSTDTGFNARALKGVGMENVDGRGVKSAKTETVAKRIADAIRSETRQSGGSFFRVMNAVAPKLLDRMFTKMALSVGKQAGVFAGAGV